MKADIKNANDLEWVIAQTKKTALGAIRKHLRAELFYLIDDVAQETYLRIYRLVLKKKAIDENQLGALVYTIAKNESYRANKKAAREMLKQKLLAEESLHHKSTMVSANDELFEIFGKVPDPYREALTLFAHGYTIREIARDLSIAEGTVKSRVSRGKEIARRLFFNAGESL